MAKFATNASSAIWWPTNVSGAILLPSSIQEYGVNFWVRCASGNVLQKLVKNGQKLQRKYVLLLNPEGQGCRERWWLQFVYFEETINLPPLSICQDYSPGHFPLLPCCDNSNTNC